MEDERILDLYWQRSETAIRETAEKYGNYCFAIADNILQNHEDANESVNDTYLKAWNAIPPKRPAVLRAFLGKIVRNLSLNRYAAQSAKKRGGNELALIFAELEGCLSAPDTTESEADMNHVAQAINAFLLAQDAETRKVFVRRYWYADSVSAIAQRFGMSESKAKSMLFRTRKKLKTHLEQEGIAI